MVCFPWAIADKQLRDSLGKARAHASPGEVESAMRDIAHNAGLGGGVKVCAPP